MKNNIIFIIMTIIICVLGYSTYKLYQKTNDEIHAIEEIGKRRGHVSFVHYEQEIDELNRKNKELYDSIELFKTKIDYLVQFKYEKEYNVLKTKTDTVVERVIDVDSVVKTYEYVDTSDTLSYKLKIGSVEKPEWYSLDFKISDEFTIINKNYENFNKLDIVSDSKGIIDDVTVLKRKEKKSIFDNFSIGPSVSMGYNFATKEPEFIVGFSITYDIKDLIWKKK